MKTQAYVYCSLQVEGTHCWPSCPFDEVAYLRDPHRHVFHIKAYKHVTHDDRDVEFIMLKHQIQNSLRLGYWNEDQKLHVFGAKSCEMIAKELIFNFHLHMCEVNEDGENGAIVEVTEEPTVLTNSFLNTGPVISNRELNLPSSNECEICGAAPLEECMANCDIKRM